MPRALKACAYCGAVPLIGATIIYVSWRFTRNDFFAGAGFYWLMLGCLLVLGGIIRFATFQWGHFRHSSRSDRVTSLAVGMLLLANFPAAAFFTLSAMSIMTRYTVRVINDSAAPLHSVVFSGPGVEVQLGPVGSGVRAERHLHFSGDGSLSCAVQQGGMQTNLVVEGYVTSGIGGDATIRFLPQLRYELHKRQG